MIVQQIRTESVVVPVGRRPVDLEWAVPNLMRSLADVGLLHPITVVESADRPGEYILVAGRNRLEAARRLDWDRIAAVVLDSGSAEIEMTEIVENLHRTTLDRAERDLLIARYVAICGRRDEADPPPGGAFAAVADRIGQSERTVRRAVARATLGDADRRALEDAGLPLADITAIAAIKRPKDRERVVALCASGLSFADAQIVLDLPDDEVSGVIAIQASAPLTPSQLVDVASQDAAERRAILSLLAASMPFIDAMREVLGDRWENDPQAERNLGDAEWAERYCGQAACYRNADRAMFVRAVGTYRRVRPARSAFERAIGWPDAVRPGDAEMAADPYLARLVRFLSARHPSRWIACPGRVNRVCYRGRSSLGTCDRCQGAGFLVG